MILADTVAAPLEYPGTAVVSTLDGVTTAIVLFVMVGLVYPSIIKNRRQFYMIVWTVMLLILMHTFTLMFRMSGLTVFLGIVTGLLQMAGFGLSVMCTGGLDAKGLADEMKRSYEVMRRGEETKEVIIPINMPKKHSESEPERTVYTIDTPPGPRTQPPSSDTPIPLE